MKKVYLSVDIEGIWGNANPRYTARNTEEYEQYRKNMIDETNLAIQYLFDLGVQEILVNDGHGGMDNLISYQLDERVSFISSNGAYKEYGMMEGLDRSFDGCGFIGYHCKSGTPNGNMAHTISGAMVDRIIINGIEASETHMNVLLASYYQVPLLFVSGDDLLHKQLLKDIGEVTFIETKQSINSMTVLNCSKETLKQRYHDGIKNGLKSEGLRLSPVTTMDIVFYFEKNASFVSRMPTIQRIDEKTVRLTANNYEELYKLSRFVIKVSNAFN